MALLFPWATKEYLLWEMSLSQVILYHNTGVDIKYPKPTDDKSVVKNLSKKELRKQAKESKRIFAEAQAEEAEKQKQVEREAEAARLRHLYGDIDSG